jgi:hypothetical protein
MLESHIRKKLDDVVWEGGRDTYSDALRVVELDWLHPWMAQSLSNWAEGLGEDYRERSRVVRNKCDISDPGVFVIYEHYLKISTRYMDVHAALRNSRI